MSINDKKNEKQQTDRTATATKLISRVIRYMLHYYKYPFLLVVACIMITAVATVIGATFPQTLVMITSHLCWQTGQMISAALLPTWSVWPV